MPYDLPKGRYPYPLNYLASDGGTVQSDFVQGDPSVEPNSTNWYVLCLTPDDLLNVMSLVEVGAPIAFPDTYNEIRTLFWQMREFPNQFPPESCVDFCQLMIDCINDTPELQNLIAQYALGAGIDGDTPEDPENLLTDLFGGQSASCDNDNIFGATTQIADWLNVLSSDVLELFETAFATPGRIGDVIEAIPGVGLLPFDDALQFLEKLSQQVKSAYDAAYDSQVRDDIRCDLFCIAQDTCDLTLEQARDYFQNKLTTSVTNQDFLGVVNDIIANNWLGEQSIWVMHWFILDALIFGTEILGIDTSRAVTVVATFFNDPDPDWQILCSCTPSNAVPVLLSTPCFGGGGSPSTITQLGGTRWSITLANGAVDVRLVFEESQGRAFNLTNLDLPLGFSRTAGFEDGVGCFISPPSTDSLSGKDLLEAGVTSNFAGTFEFDMTLV